MPTYRIIYCLGLLTVSAFFSGCYTVPQTGRSSLNMLPEGSMSALSDQAFSELQKKETVCTDPAKQERVQRVGARIVTAASQDASLPPLSQWTFIVFQDDKTVNAFAMPGGKVAVYTGLLNLTQNDAQLAAVIGHEVGHVVARHGNERMSQKVLLAGAGAGLAVGMIASGQSEERTSAALSAFGAGSAVGIILPFSRLHENEADTLGLIYMARAGYDPREAVNFWEIMSAQGKGKVPELLSTHPSDATRIARLQQQMPAAMVIYKEALSAQAP